MYISNWGLARTRDLIHVWRSLLQRMVHLCTTLQAVSPPSPRSGRNTVYTQRLPLPSGYFEIAIIISRRPPPRSNTALYKRQKHAYFRSLLKLSFNFHPINWLFSDGLETPYFDFLIEDTLLGFLVAATEELPGRFRVQLQGHIGELELRISEYIQVYSRRGEPTDVVQGNFITAPTRPSLSEGDKGESQPSHPSGDIRLPCPKTRDPGLSSSNTPFLKMRIMLSPARGLTMRLWVPFPFVLAVKV